MVYGNLNRIQDGFTKISGGHVRVNLSERGLLLSRTSISPYVGFLNPGSDIVNGVNVLGDKPIKSVPFERIVVGEHLIDVTGTLTTLSGESYPLPGKNSWKTPNGSR